MTDPKPGPELHSDGTNLPFSEPRQKQWIEMAWASRACNRPQADDAPRRWLTYWDTQHDDVQEVVAWLRQLPRWVRLDALTQLDARMRAVLEGSVRPNDAGEPLKKIGKHPEMFELRWDLEGTFVRQYHGEPAGDDISLFVRTHIHLKADHGELTAGEHQEAAMRSAADRYVTGKREGWSQPRAGLGLPDGQP